MTTTERVAESINWLMFSQNKKNTELAELLSITNTQAGNIRKGIAKLDTDALFTVAHWLGVRTDDLARGYELSPKAVAA